LTSKQFLNVGEWLVNGAYSFGLDSATNSVVKKNNGNITWSSTQANPWSAGIVIPANTPVKSIALKNGTWAIFSDLRGQGTVLAYAAAKLCPTCNDRMLFLQADYNLVLYTGPNEDCQTCPYWSTAGPPGFYPGGGPLILGPIP
jgi:hypothetical protein